MKITIFFYLLVLVLGQSTAQIIDIGGVWEVKCPRECSCEFLHYADLPLHQWINITNNLKRDTFNRIDDDHPLANELLKVATCVVSEDPKNLLAKLPNDIQIFTILESGSGDTEIIFQSADMQRFTDLISLDIQGIENKNPLETNSITEMKTGIIISADTLLPLGSSLLYLNLERVTLTTLSSINKNKANLIIKPMNSPEDESDIDYGNQTGHRLIFLSQQSGVDNDDKEILPYDIYKQEMEGYRESPGLFAGLSALTHLRVSDCALKNISWHMFDGLDSLQYLSLQKNDLKFIPEFCFYGTPNLKHLSLANNQLLTLTSVDLAGLLILEMLDLSGNNLTFLSELSFPPFPALLSADFRDNPLESIFPSTFEIMNKTIRLELGGKGAKLKLEKNAFLGLKNLEILHLYNVDISVLERFILQGMPSLTELKLRGNISTIEFDAFIDLHNIIDLDLSHCHISKISMDAFYGLENVNHIDLSYNDLDYIPPGLFSIQQQKQLKKINLSKNKLLKLPPDFFKNLRLSNKQFQIQNIRLEGNPWDCNCDMTTWNPHLINRTKETLPRCFTPKSLRNWGVFYALRKGGLECKWPKRRLRKKRVKIQSMEDNNIS